MKSSGKRSNVPLDLLNERPRLDPVELGQVLVQHDVAFPHDQDALLDRRQWNEL